MDIRIILGVLVAVTFITIQQERIKKESKRQEKLDSFKRELKLDESKKIEEIKIPKELKPVVSVKKTKKCKKKEKSILELEKGKKIFQL